MDDARWPLKWRASWIDSGEAVVAGKLSSFDPAVSVRAYARVRFEKEFRLDEVPDTARCRLTADSRYLLVVNGSNVGRGPVRGQPDRLHYDTYDLASVLRTGVNHLQVEVTFYGAANPFWQPPREDLNYGRFPLLLLEAELCDDLVVTDGSWQVRPLAGWSLVGDDTPSGPAGLPGLPMERFDARVGEAQARPARVPVITHYNGGDRTHPPSYPYGRLLPRPIGPLGERQVQPASWQRLRRPGRLAIDTANPARRVDGFLQGSCTVERLDDLPDGFDVTPQEPVLLAADFGRIVAGRLRLRLRTERPGQVSVAFRERFDPFGGTEFAPQVAGCQLLTAAGQVSFAANEFNGFRWILILLENEEAARVVLEEVALDETTYPFSGEAGFDCDDAELVRLYQAGRRTVELNSQDAFTDCPTREQRAWTGDGWIHAQTHLTCSDDWRLARRYVELADSPRPDGLLPMTTAGDGEYARRLTIPDWSLYWIHGLYRWHEYAGDPEFVSRHLPSARRILTWYEQHRTDTGLVGHLPEWNLVDWSSIFVDGCSSIINGLLARALDEFAAMSVHVGNRGDAAWASAFAADIRGAFDSFWDARRGTYLDHVDGNSTGPASSQLANAAALLANAVPADRVERVLDNLAGRLVVRSWIGGQGDVAVQRAARTLAGRLEADWDVEHEHVRAQPFGSALVHEAQLQHGRIPELTADLRNWTRFLEDGYDTFGECWDWGTPCHGWSSCPTADLVRAVLGVTPLEPGFGRARIAPRPDLAPGLRGVVPTPYGPIRVWCDDSTVKVSSPVVFTFVLDGLTQEDVPPGEHVYAIDPPAEAGRLR